MRTHVIALSSAVLACAASAVAQFIDFEDVASSGNPIVTQVDSGGFRFTSEHFHTIDTPASFGGVPHQAGSTIYIGHEGGNLGRIITMMPLAGGTFDVYGIGAAVLWLPDNPGYPNATQVQLVGYDSGGGSTTVELLLDNPAAWQTYALSLTNLTSLTINGVQNHLGDYAFGVDNIRVPEPTALAGIAVLLLVARLR